MVFQQGYVFCDNFWPQLSVGLWNFFFYFRVYLTTVIFFCVHCFPFLLNKACNKVILPFHYFPTTFIFIEKFSFCFLYDFLLLFMHPSILHICLLILHACTPFFLHIFSFFDNNIFLRQFFFFTHF